MFWNRSSRDFILYPGIRWADSPIFLFCVLLSDAIQSMEGVELRLAPDETAYVINLTAAEAERVLDITENNTAKTEFEASVSCIGAAVCQVGVRDSQSLLQSLCGGCAEGWTSG